MITPGNNVQKVRIQVSMDTIIMRVSTRDPRFCHYIYSSAANPEVSERICLTESALEREWSPSMHASSARSTCTLNLIYIYIYYSSTYVIYLLVNHLNQSTGQSIDPRVHIRPIEPRTGRSPHEPINFTCPRPTDPARPRTHATEPFHSLLSHFL
jgi:hypothetical protein